MHIPVLYWALSLALFHPCDVLINLSLSLSLSHTHTHTHTHDYLIRNIYIPLPFSSVSLSLAHSLSLSLTLTRSLKLSHTQLPSYFRVGNIIVIPNTSGCIHCGLRVCLGWRWGCNGYMNDTGRPQCIHESYRLFMYAGRSGYRSNAYTNNTYTHTYISDDIHTHTHTWVCKDYCDVHSKCEVLNFVVSNISFIQIHRNFYKLYHETNSLSSAKINNT